jgi:NADPH-ferrihemoprotein reductase
VLLPVRSGYSISDDMRWGGRRRGYTPAVVDLQNFEDALLQPVAHPAVPAVFLLATYGEGEPTDNARGFCKWIKNSVKKSRHLSPLQGLRVAVFGLGDRRYEHFNSVAVLVDKQVSRSPLLLTVPYASLVV